MAEENIQSTKNSYKSIIYDFIILLKPELTGLSVFTAIISGVLALNNLQEINYSLFYWLGLGTLFVGGGAGVMNQFIERSFDLKMKRTEKRPIPDNRILPQVALYYGIVISVLGVLILKIYVNNYSAILAIITWVIYVAIYTPLKRITFFATIVGAIPGALPPLIGWVGISGKFSVEGWILFAILFLWQMPHFYALAWMYRNDYAKAEFQMLSVVDPTGKSLSWEILFNTTFLLPISLLPLKYFNLSESYFYITIILNLMILFYAIKFSADIKKYNQQKDNDVNRSAKKLFFSTLIYLPVLFLLIFYFKR